MFAAVTGASGHLGSNLVRILLARGYRVRVLIHNSYKALENLQVEKVQGDILDIESLTRCFREVDVVFHLAARISVISWDRRSVEAVNIQGVHNVIQASKEMGISGLVHVSSFHAHLQKPLEEKLDENRPLIESYNHPPYNYSKAVGEKIVLNAMKEGLKAIIMTPAGMIGPYDYQPSHFGTTIVNMAKQKMPFIVNAGLNWVDTRDVSEAILRAVDRRRFG